MSSVLPLLGLPAQHTSTGIAARHPDYESRYPDWVLLRLSHQGERFMKAAGLAYLPATDGMIQKGMATPKQPGSQLYEAYKARATFPPLISEAVRSKVGVLNSGPAKIELPARLEAMLEQATIEGESLQMLLERMHEELLLVGRIGLLVDPPTGAGPNAVPLIATYSAERILNWDDGRREDGAQRMQFVVLDESEYERQPGQFDWRWTEKYRVLAIGPTGDLPEDQYGTALVRGEQQRGMPASFLVPQIAGAAMDRIPFIFVNPADLVPAPDVPPLLSLANLGLTIYRGSADYRHALFMQAQETLVLTGVTPPDEDQQPLLGAGATIYIDSPEGDAKYIGVSAAGLAEMREAEENDYRKAAELGAQVLNQATRQAEAGETVRLRVVSRTASLISIANTAAAGLRDALQICAQWVGADPAEVIVEPNTEFVATNNFTGQDALNWIQAKTMGYPISRATLHLLLSDNNVTQLTFEQEDELIETEEPILAGVGLPGQEPNSFDRSERASPSDESERPATAGSSR